MDKKFINEEDFKNIFNYLHICSDWEASRKNALESFIKIHELWTNYNSQHEMCFKCVYSNLCINHKCESFFNKD